MQVSSSLGVVEVQQGMVSSDGRLASSLVPPATLHLTLMVLRLGTERENMETCVSFFVFWLLSMSTTVLSDSPWFDF